METDKQILKFKWRSKSPRLAKTIEKEQSVTHAIQPQDLLQSYSFKSYYEATGNVVFV